MRKFLEVQPAEERLSAETLTPRGGFDLRDIDLSALSSSLHSGQRHIKAEQLRQLLYERIQRMIKVNPSRVKHMEKLERAIDRYNEGCANFASDPQLVNPQEKITQFSSMEARRDQSLDAYDDALVELTDEVAKEEQRSTQEELSEEELAIFDLLATDASLSKDDHDQVKRVVHDLLTALRPTFNVIDWQKKPVTLGRAYSIIEDELFELPQPTYSREVSGQKCSAIFLYVQERYKNDGTTSVA